MNKDSEFLAGRDSGKSRTTKAWINKDEWDMMKSFRHYRETIIWATGCRSISDDDQALFDNQYAEKYPDNAKILNIK